MATNKTNQTAPMDLSNLSEEQLMEALRAKMAAVPEAERKAANAKARKVLGLAVGGRKAEIDLTGIVPGKDAVAVYVILDKAGKVQASFQSDKGAKGISDNTGMGKLRKHLTENPKVLESLRAGSLRVEYRRFVAQS